MCWNSAINILLASWYRVSSSQWGLMCDKTVAIRLCSLRKMICKTVNCGFWLALRSPETQTHSNAVLIIIRVQCTRPSNVFLLYIYLHKRVDTNRTGNTVLRPSVGRTRHSCWPPPEATVFRLWIPLSIYRRFLHGVCRPISGSNRIRKTRPSSATPQPTKSTWHITRLNHVCNVRRLLRPETYNIFWTVTIELGLIISNLHDVYGVPAEKIWQFRKLVFSTWKYHVFLLIPTRWLHFNLVKTKGIKVLKYYYLQAIAIPTI